MTDNTQIARAADLERQTEIAPGFTSYYANDTQVQTTPWDVRLMFGVIVGVSQKEQQAVVQRLADVRISLPHAKKLLEVLTEQIQHYETEVGFIALPRDGK
jgi:hypothetical protein